MKNKTFLATLACLLAIPVMAMERTQEEQELVDAATQEQDKARAQEQAAQDAIMAERAQQQKSDESESNAVLYLEAVQNLKIASDKVKKLYSRVWYLADNESGKGDEWLRNLIPHPEAALKDPEEKIKFDLFEKNSGKARASMSIISTVNETASKVSELAESFAESEDFKKFEELRKKRIQLENKAKFD